MACLSFRSTVLHHDVKASASRQAVDLHVRMHVSGRLSLGLSVHRVMLLQQALVLLHGLCVDIRKSALHIHHNIRLMLAHVELHVVAFRLWMKVKVSLGRSLLPLVLLGLLSCCCGSRLSSSRVR
jgi:hypothetical protein